MGMNLRGLTDKLIELVYPTATYCIVCGNFIDDSRQYCMCDHCIRHINWGRISVDVKRQAEAERRSEEADGNVAYLSEESSAMAYDEPPLAELQAGCRSAARELPDSVLACFEYGLYSRRVVFELKYNGHSYVARVGAHIMADRVRTDPSAAFLHGCDFVTAVPVSRRKLQRRGFNQAEKLAKYFCKESGMKQLPSLLLRTKDTEALRSLSPAERSMKLEGVFAVDEAKLRRLRQVKATSDSLAEQGKAESHAAYRTSGSGNGESCVPCKAAQNGSGNEYSAENLPSGKRDARHLWGKEESRESETLKSLPLAGMRILLIDDIYTTGATARHCTQVLKAAGASEVHLLVLATGSDFAVNTATS